MLVVRLYQAVRLQGGGGGGGDGLTFVPSLFRKSAVFFRRGSKKKEGRLGFLLFIPGGGPGWCVISK